MKQKRVIIAFPQQAAYLRRIAIGISAYYKAGQKQWSVERMPELEGFSIESLRHWPGNGAIVSLLTQRDLHIAHSLKFPIVNIASIIDDRRIPSVIPDHRAIGRVAAMHLLARHYCQFAFCGNLGMTFSKMRQEGFCDTIEEAGYQCRVMELPQENIEPGQWRDHRKPIARWIRSMPLPIGIMACNDDRANILLEACLEVGLRVPEDVAIIGADNDSVVFPTAVSLSTVARQDREIGFKAAELLDRLISGMSPPAAPILLPPEGVVQRRSTESYGVADTNVQIALAYMSEHLGEPFGVERLLGETGLSRRPFELRFGRVVGKTPHEFIITQRVERARQMLAEPGGQNFTAIAAACGFTNLRHFRTAFQRLAGLSPAAYRHKQVEVRG
jgi:LacI family transcriptional regulator